MTSYLLGFFTIYFFNQTSPIEINSKKLKNREPLQGKLKNSGDILRNLASPFKKSYYDYMTETSQVTNLATKVVTLVKTQKPNWNWSSKSQQITQNQKSSAYGAVTMQTGNVDPSTQTGYTNTVVSHNPYKSENTLKNPKMKHQENSSLAELEINFSDKKLKDVSLIESAWIQLDNKAISLIPFNHTLIKRFFFDIFIIQLLVSDPNQLSQNDFLNLEVQSAISIYVKFLFPIDKKLFVSEAKKIVQNTNIDINQNHIQSYLKAISRSIKKGDTLIITGKKLFDGIEVVKIETPDAVWTIESSEEEIIKDIFSLWLGEFPKNKNLQNMKNRLLKK